MQDLAFAKVLTTFLLLAALHAFGQREHVLYRFNGTTGSTPIAPLLSDSAGNFYGTANRGGTYDGGTAFMISPKPGGGWVGKLIYEFGQGTDGVGPYESLLLDANGNLYGITKYGGVGRDGTVFKLTPSSGLWKETILKSFTTASIDGGNPGGGLVFDKAGNLYGTTLSGGDLSGCAGFGCGTVYELSPGPGDSWTETVLYAPPGHAASIYPTGTLTFDSAGNLYGADLHEIYEFTPSGGGTWTRSVLHTFRGPDGDEPNGNLVFDKSGNLYGTTFIGGSTLGRACESQGCGVIFELSPNGGSWFETILHEFSQNGVDGYLPQDGLAIDSKGALYGTAPFGGAHSDCYGGACGIAFAMLQNPPGRWTENILYNFTGENNGGTEPEAAPTFGPDGTLVGMTCFGGLNDQGTVFFIAP